MPVIVHGTAVAAQCQHHFLLAFETDWEPEPAELEPATLPMVIPSGSSIKNSGFMDCNSTLKAWLSHCPGTAGLGAQLQINCTGNHRVQGGLLPGTHEWLKLIRTQSTQIWEEVAKDDSKVRASDRLESVISHLYIIGSVAQLAERASHARGTGIETRRFHSFYHLKSEQVFYFSLAGQKKECCSAKHIRPMWGSNPRPQG